MAKYRAMLGDRFIEVEASSEEEAQNLAFAKAVRDLKPQDFTVWATGDQEDWADTAEAKPC
jgi:hypothetical protein